MVYKAASSCILRPSSSLLKLVNITPVVIFHPSHFSSRIHNTSLDPLLFTSLP